ncbi:MAG: hypothetical protein QNK11_01705 [Legionella sp.]|nr:hypothetical protein [Legionella sp.]
MSYTADTFFSHSVSKSSALTRAERKLGEFSGTLETAIKAFPDGQNFLNNQEANERILRVRSVLRVVQAEPKPETEVKKNIDFSGG